MLKRFLYLDETALDQYLSAYEGGRTVEHVVRQKDGKATQGRAGIKQLGVEHERNSGNEVSLTLSDTAESKFERLVQIVEDQNDVSTWLEVMDPTSDFTQVAVGAMVSWECDVYIPEISNVLSSGGELAAAISTIEAIRPLAESFNFDFGGIPGQKELSGVQSIVNSMGSNLIIVGDDSETDWKVSGKIKSDCIHADVDDFDDRAIIVGKISKILGEGQFKPYVSFPGMNLVSREKRRAMERTKPQEGQESQYLSGPAATLDILAIYR
ncbi:DUF6414 family protein [Glutamicibacter sp. AOP38-B1-38]|uniref:DUF6414 family protein n=1 Tax=unclassified Glutamicibacter TaxID=2627139 RepID=UPI000BB68EBE|nr:hypothetical protein [Glutamicibacter sp. BW80]